MRRGRCGGKQLKGDSRLYSARVTDGYRALLLRVTGEEYLLVAVKPRGSVYENLDRYQYQVNPVSGGVEFMDIMHLSSFGKPQVQVEIDHGPKPLFADYPPGQLVDLGVAARRQDTRGSAGAGHDADEGRRPG